MSEERKKLKLKFIEIDQFLVLLTCFLPAKPHVRGAILGHVGGENKKKAELSVFFLVGPDSSTSEDSSTIEYSASALN